MEMNKNGMDRLFREAASKFRKPLSEEEKAGLWAALARRRRHRPVFWYWITAGAAGLILGAFVFFYGGEALQTADEMAQKDMGQVADAVESGAGTEATIDAVEDEIPEATGQTSLSDAESPMSRSGFSPSVGRSAEMADDLRGSETEADLRFTSTGLRGAELPDPEPIGLNLFPEHISEGDFPEEPSLFQLRDWVESGDAMENRGDKSVLSAVAGLTSLPLKKLSLREADLKYLFPTVLRSVESQRDERVTNKWFADVFVQIEWMNTDIKGTAGSADLAAGLERTISPWLSLSTGVSVGRRLTENFNLLTGIEYQRFTEKFDFRQQSTQYKMEYNERAYFLDDGSGNPYWVDGAVLTAVSSEAKLVAPNHHEFIKIPILVEYLLPLDSWEFGLSGGLAFNVFESHSGYLIDGEGAYRAIGADDYNRRWLSDIRLGFYAGYPIGENWSLYARTGFRVYPGNWLKTSGELEKNVNAITFGMGFRRDF